MRLFAVRLIKDKQAVGFFWASDTESLWWMIDSVCDPGACEYHRIVDRAAIAWESRVAGTLGAGNNFTEKDEVTGESHALKELRTTISFEFAFEDYLYGKVEGWVKVPFADEPGGGIHELVERESRAKRKPTKSRKAIRKKK